MLTRIAVNTFHAAVVVIAAAVAVWLNVTGQVFHVAGLLLEMWAVLAAVLFGFRLAEGLRAERLSIWAGPVRSVRAREGQSQRMLREAA